MAKACRTPPLGASEWVGEPHRAVAERASAPVGFVPGQHRSSTAGRQIGGAAAAVVGALFAYCRRQQPEPARQQRNGLASARGIRSEPWRLQPPGTDGPARCGAELLLRCEPVTGEVLIADRGYATANELRRCLAPSGPDARDFIVRVGWKALALRDAQGDPFHLIAHLEKVRADAGPEEWAVQAVVGSASQPSLLPIRLIAVPPPPDKAEINRTKLKRRASKHQDTLDPRSLLAAGFMVLVTSLPAAISADEVCAAYRLRWQIELAFKRMKSLLHIDRLPTRTDAGSLSWLYAHLILVLLTEDICQDFLESSP